MVQFPGSQKRLHRYFALCALAALFATAYTLAPLYYSNQNQYFLHGLADAGHGFLHEDWLAGTLDPTPVFSGLVCFTARFLSPWLFQVYHGLLLGVYAAAMLGLFLAVVDKDLAARRWPVFIALLFLLHCALMRWLSYRLLGQDYPWYFQAGVAGQYVLGAMLQPSAFGVLLVAAVALFVWEKPFLAGLAVALAATVHSTYLLPGALLTIGFLTALILEGRRGQALALGSITFVLVVPVTLYVLLTFAPTSAETFAESQAILVLLRIPHHARPDLWLDAVAVAQMGWICASIFLVRSGWQGQETVPQRVRVFVVVAVTFGLMLLLSLVQAATGSHTLALLFPWRVSAVLVPIATTVILARLAAMSVPGLDHWLVRGMAAVVVVLLVAGGIWIMVDGQGFRLGEEELPMMDFVRNTAKSGDVYMLPVRVPDLAKTTRGSLSGDFKPLAAKRGDARLIPLDLQRFRLYTGAPIYVDFKSIPYKDTEVIEWRRRLLLAERAQELIRGGRLPEALASLRGEGVTHLVQPADTPLFDPGLHEIYQDRYYRILVISH